MFDRPIQNALEPLWRVVATPLLRWGVTPNQVTVAAWVTGLMSAVLIASHQFHWALALLLISRALDALDGALARQRGASDAGGYLDIVLDFWFYVAIPLAFAWIAPTHNAMAAAALVASYVLNATSWLALTSMRPRAALSGDRNQATGPRKSLSFIPSLTEGGETLLAYAAMCIWPQNFAPIAWGFATLCLLSAIYRTHTGWQLLSAQSQAPDDHSHR